MPAFMVFVNNGFRFEYRCEQEGLSIAQARKEWLRLNKGSWAGQPENVKLKRNV